MELDLPAIMVLFLCYSLASAINMFTRKIKRLILTVFTYPVILENKSVK